ncbi:MAG: hypothetical protein SFZ23_02840 [Planctomycetota bacterium]|nr:hypothetical protein [Planctomycetota bacterium]
MLRGAGSTGVERRARPEGLMKSRVSRSSFLSALSSAQPSPASRSVQQEFTAWHAAGFRKIWLDTAADNWPLEGRRKRWAYLQLAHNPQIAALGLKVGAEPLPYFENPYPTPQDPWSEVLDDCALRYGTFFTESNPVTSWIGGPRVFKYSVDPNLTEVHLALNPTRTIELVPGQKISEPPFSLAEVGEARARGFIITPYNCFGEYCEYAKRWYSMGKVYVPDFNGDGAVNPQDREKLQLAILAAGQYTAKLFGFGQLHPSGPESLVIDQNDLDYYDALKAAHDQYIEDNGNFPDARNPACYVDYGIANTE